MVHYNITVTGKVQGVFFRASTQSKAIELGITGWVRNQTDGTVYIEAEGVSDQLHTLINWCKEGPSHARVEQVTYQQGKLQHFTGFQIRR